jgi:hypothetical protein
MSDLITQQVQQLLVEAQGTLIVDEDGIDDLTLVSGDTLLVENDALSELVIEGGGQGLPGASPNRSVYDELVVVPVAGVLTLDLEAAGTFIVTLAANITQVILTGLPPPGRSVLSKLHLIQGVGGNKTISGWPAGTRFPSGITPALSTVAGYLDTIAIEAGGAGVLVTTVQNAYREP